MDEKFDLCVPLPERRGARAGDFDTRPAAVEDWLRNLPVTDLGETGRQVYQVLHSVNRVVLRASRRVAFLEQLRSIVDYLGNGLRHQYRGHQLPLPQRPRQVMALAGALLNEMAIGYEIAVTTARLPGQPSLRSRTLALALERGLRYRARIALEHWLVYQPTPPGTWQRLHALFSLAEAYRLAARSVPSGDSGGTPAGTYKQVVLAAAVGPQRLHAGDLIEIWRLLGHWAESALLVTSDDERASDGVFRVPRSADQPPHAAVSSLAHADDRILLTAPLVRRMEQELARTDRQHAFWRREPLRDLPPDLCQRLMFALGEPPGRNHRRWRAEARVQAATGLVAIHRLLCHELALDEVQIEAREHQFQSRDVAGGTTTADVWSLLYPQQLMHRLNVVEPTPAGTEPPIPEAPIPGAPLRADDWRLANLSARGYCLVRDDVSVRIQIGELVALREAAGRRLSWQLGVVRWLRAVDRRLQLGLEVLNLGPKPVALYATEPGGQTGLAERALLLPANPPLDADATLIASPAVYSTGRLARVRHEGTERMVMMGAVREANAVSVRFAFRFVDESLEPLASSG